MPDPTTPNLGLFVPARGADPGTWDTPVNTNMSALDAALGQTVTVAITNVNVTLSPAQYQCGTIVFSGVQTADVTITFPAFGRMYNIFNNCTNNNTWVINLGIAAGVVCAPPGELTTVFTDGVNFFYLGMGTVGTLWKYAGTAVPRWVTASTQPPFLLCDGSAFSAITYPALNQILGGAAVPDMRGRTEFNLNLGTGRLTAIDGNTLFANGGSNAITLAKANLPNYALTVTDPTHTHAVADPTHSHLGAGFNFMLTNTATTTQAFGGDISQFDNSASSATTSPAATGIGIFTAATGISVNSGGSGTAYTYASPSIVSGITMIRAG